MNRWLIYNVVLTLAALGASLYLGWVRPDLLPEKVPVHWNAAGEANQFVPRDHILPYFLIVPGFMAFFVLLSLALPWLSPVQFSIDRFRHTYNFLIALVLTLFAYIHGIALAASMGLDVNMNKVLLGGMFLFFALLGNVLGKVQRNFFVGIRTPWTLADETVWIRTHRMAAWVWVAGSLVGFVTVMIGPSLWGQTTTVWVALTFFLAMALSPVVYSLVLYKRLQREGKLAASAVAGSPEGQP
jgi:uncharacterized membrane protein